MSQRNISSDSAWSKAYESQNMSSSPVHFIITSGIQVSLEFPRANVFPGLDFVGSKVKKKERTFQKCVLIISTNRHQQLHQCNNIRLLYIQFILLPHPFTKLRKGA